MSDKNTSDKTIGTGRPVAAPVTNIETAAFWEAASQNQLLLKRCNSCTRLHYYPRALCPFCYGETAWVPASGAGIIYSYSIMRRAPVPYAIAYVTLDDGPTIMSNIVDCDLDDIKIGQRVQSVFTASDNGQKVCQFRPVSAD